MTLKDKIKENKKKLLDAIKNLGKTRGDKVQATVYGDVVIVTPEDKPEANKK
jgi:hypothetical protein